MNIKLAATVFGAFLLIFGSFPALPCLADIYKYVDKNGVIHLTNVPNDFRYKVWIRETPQQRMKREFNSGLYDKIISKCAEMHNVDHALVKAVIKTESDFNHRAVSRKGARGLMQLMPGTASIYRVHDSFDPEANIDGGVRYLRYLMDLFRGNLHLVLAAYNAGENAVIKYNYSIPPYPETKTYVRRVMQHLRKYSAD